MSGKLITFTNDQYQFLGVTQMIQSEKYSLERNYFIYNLVFVFLNYDNVENFKPIIRKSSNLFKSFEIENNFLSNPEEKKKIATILPKIMGDLNNKNETFTNLDEINSIYLKVFPPQVKEDIEVLNYHVPVQIYDLTKAIGFDWDLTYTKIIPLINGINYVKKIAKEANIEIELVKKCLKQLIYYEYIQMIDVFQYSNVYQIISKEKIVELFKNLRAQHEFCEFIQLKQGVNVAQVLGYYSSMKFNIKLNKIIDTSSKNFNHRLFIIFGVLNGIIRRVNDYPVLLNLDKYKDLPLKLKSLLKSMACVDEICCEMDFTKRELFKILKSLPDFKVISK